MKIYLQATYPNQNHVAFSNNCTLYILYIYCLRKESLIGKEAFFDSFSKSFHINMKKGSTKRDFFP